LSLRERRRRAALQELPLARVAGERDGTLELNQRLGVPIQILQ